ncbi:MAG: YitT family protein, partial [Faecousia sp.]
PSNMDIAGIVLYIINIPLLILAYRSLGRWFFVCTLVCVTFQTIFLTFLPIPTPPILSDRLAGAIVGGVVAGYGSGLTLRNGGCGGGQDILGLYFMKKDRNFSVGKISMMVNIVVYVACALMFDLTTVVYSLIYVAVYSFVTDLTHTQNQNMAALIITTSDEVLPTIQRMTNRSATYWGGIRYYTKSDCRVIFMALSKYEAVHISQAIKQLDDHAFVTFFKVDAIVGNFSKHL